MNIGVFIIGVVCIVISVSNIIKQRGLIARLLGERNSRIFNFVIGVLLILLSFLL